MFLTVYSPRSLVKIIVTCERTKQIWEVQIQIHMSQLFLMYWYTVKNTDLVMGQDTPLIKLYNSALSAVTRMPIWSQSYPTWTKNTRIKKQAHIQFIFKTQRERNLLHNRLWHYCNIYHKRESVITLNLWLTSRLSQWFLLRDFGLCWCFKWCCWSLCWTFNLQALLHQSLLDRQHCLYTALCVSLM